MCGKKKDSYQLLVKNTLEFIPISHCKFHISLNDKTVHVNLFMYRKC